MISCNVAESGRPIEARAAVCACGPKMMSRRLEVRYWAGSVPARLCALYHRSRRGAEGQEKGNH